MRWSIGITLAMLLGGGAVRVDGQKAPETAGAAAGGVKPVASVLEIMKTMTIPFSNGVFEAGGEAPTDDKGWEAVRAQAIALAEAGNLLMLGSRAKDHAAWLKFSRAQVDAAETAAKAAAARNADGLSKASDALYETCSGCHKVYMKGSAQ
jgi:cytochrome c556